MRSHQDGYLESVPGHDFPDSTELFSESFATRMVTIPAVKGFLRQYRTLSHISVAIYVEAVNVR